MKKIGIITKLTENAFPDIVKDFVHWLTDKNFDIYPDSEMAKFLKIKGYDRDSIPSLVEMIVVLGGDGTLLSVSRLIKGMNIPILGVNMGSLGFITEVNKNEILDVFKLAVEGRCDIEDRIMITAEIFRKGECITESNALNDVVITKGALARIIDIETYIDNKYVTTFKSDGLIISTPTGSTGYSLSAGGPVLYPTLHCFVITPICPHTLTNRPIVINDDMVIEIILNAESEDVVLTLDGQVGFPLRKKDVIRVKKSSFTTKLIIPFEKDYFNVLRQKLKWGER